MLRISQQTTNKLGQHRYQQTQAITNIHKTTNTNTNNLQEAHKKKLKRIDTTETNKTKHNEDSEYEPETNQ